jgi:hypothetical protein
MQVEVSQRLGMVAVVGEEQIDRHGPPTKAAPNGRCGETDWLHPRRGFLRWSEFGVRQSSPSPTSRASSTDHISSGVSRLTGRFEEPQRLLRLVVQTH